MEHFVSCNRKSRCVVKLLMNDSWKLSLMDQMILSLRKWRPLPCSAWRIPGMRGEPGGLPSWSLESGDRLDDCPATTASMLKVVGQACEVKSSCILDSFSRLINYVIQEEKQYRSSTTYMLPRVPLHSTEQKVPPVKKSTERWLAGSLNPDSTEA